ncbi:MAG: hypothetical protein R3A45_07950 [Bdellovibrionota bacterium]|nr:hypothetical protein [Deltaproteobacteria bacterium]
MKKIKVFGLFVLACLCNLNHAQAEEIVFELRDIELAKISLDEDKGLSYPSQLHYSIHVNPMQPVGSEITPTDFALIKTAKKLIVDIEYGEDLPTRVKFFKGQQGTYSYLMNVD